MKKKSRLKALIILMVLSIAFLVFTAVVSGIKSGSFRALAGYLFLRSDTEEENQDKTADGSVSSIDNKISRMRLYIDRSILDDGSRTDYLDKLEAYKNKKVAGKITESDKTSIQEFYLELEEKYKSSKKETENYYTKVASENNKTGMDSACRSAIESLTSEYVSAMSDGDYRTAYDKVAAIEHTIAEQANAYVSLDVKNIEQYPELPTGCESVSATILLNYYGMNLNKTDIADKYLAYSDDPDRGFTGGSPHEEARGRGYWCNAGPIADAMKKAVKDHGASLRIVNITGESFDGLLLYVRSGHPVIMWGLTDMNGSHHTLVLTGYDIKRGVCSFADPLKKGITEYPISACRRAYDKMGKQGIIVEEK